jgi:type IV secretion system protein VirD4
MNILTLEHDPNSLPVYFLLDEFRQLKKMDEIMTKLPYVAGYNIKLAIIIQDLKNLDEIYGETSRHSLLGNCGYQLVLGANDQATAEYASRALGKRTIRYKSESRTIEILGLPRRTKVEQIRERDLMMPQEVRQMPESKMILLVEGQRPIYGDKLRFFNTQPFKAAEAYSQSYVPDVPAIDYLPHRPVPALTTEYANVGQQTVEQTASLLPSHPRSREEPRLKVIATPSPSIPEARDGKQENRRTVNLSVNLPSTGIDKKSAIPPIDIDDRIEEVEAKLKPSAERLLKAVNEKVDASATSPRKRKSYLDIFNATVPDPEDVSAVPHSR